MIQLMMIVIIVNIIIVNDSERRRKRKRKRKRKGRVMWGGNRGNTRGEESRKSSVLEPKLCTTSSMPQTFTTPSYELLTKRPIRSCACSALFAPMSTATAPSYSGLHTPSHTLGWIAKHRTNPVCASLSTRTHTPLGSSQNLHIRGHQGS